MMHDVASLPRSVLLGDCLTELANELPRRRGREARSRDRVAAYLIPQAAWESPRHVGDATRILSDDALARIHETSLTILEEIGMDFLSPQARALMSRCR
jgi:trimethylamine--corrinoid protein Co-methyltransferase